MDRNLKAAKNAARVIFEDVNQAYNGKKATPNGDVSYTSEEKAGYTQRLMDLESYVNDLVAKAQNLGA